MNENTKKSKLQTFTNKYVYYYTNKTLFICNKYYNAIFPNTTSTEIDDLVPSIDERINIHEANGVKRPEPPLHGCNNSFYINVVWGGLKQMIIYICHHPFVRFAVAGLASLCSHFFDGYLPPVCQMIHSIWLCVKSLTKRYMKYTNIATFAYSCYEFLCWLSNF